MARFNSTFTRNHLYHIRGHLELQQSNSVIFQNSAIFQFLTGRSLKKLLKSMQTACK